MWSRCGLIPLFLGGVIFATSAPAKLNTLLLKLPLAFEPNHGQVDPEAKFVSRALGYTMLFGSDEVVVRFEEQKRKGLEVSMKLAGSRRRPHVEPFGPQPGKSHYLIGSDPARWRRNIPNYAGVRYRDVYPGIDWICYGNHQQLEFDFVVAPGADPNKIELSLEGAGNLEIDAQGDLLVGAPIRLRRPVVYQEFGGTKRVIEGSYRLAGERRVKFRVGPYNRRRALVIDPVLSYSAVLTGDPWFFSSKIAVDARGDMYVAAGLHVTKLRAGGTARLYSVYLGDADSGGEITGIAVDTEGSAYLTGEDNGTSSIPVKNASQSGCRGWFCSFVAKLNADGSDLFYSFFVIGGGGIAVDQARNVYLTGWDGSVTKLDAEGSAVYRMALGAPLLGPRGESIPVALGSAIAVDSSGSAYITGWTFSPDSPPDAFVARLNPDGSALVYARKLGGSGSDTGTGIALDADGNAYVTGRTTSADFPMLNPFQGRLRGRSDAFAAKLSPQGELLYSTYIGGGAEDSGNALAVDSAGNAYIAGDTHSTDFPAVRALPFPTGVPVYKSTDGGVSWHSAAGGLTDFRVTSLVVDPFTPSNLYAGTPNGVFRSTDGGAAWAVSGLEGMMVTSLAVDPAERGVLHAGVDALFPNPVSVGGFPSGIFRSTDGGENWFPSDRNFRWSRLPQIFALAAAPTFPSTIYAAIADTVIRSTDGGSNWVMAPFGLCQPCLTVAADPRNRSTVYVGGGGGVRKSVDGGVTWTAAGGLPSGPPWGWQIKALAIDPADPGILYAAAQGGVFKSSDSGLNWSNITPTTGPFSCCVPGGLAAGIGLTVDPANPSTIYVGGDTGVFRSTDGGGTWNRTGLTGARVNVLTVNPTAPSTIYAGNSAWSRKGFLLKLDPLGSALVYSTYLGGAGTDRATGVVVDRTGAAYVTGYTDSADFPITLDQPPRARSQETEFGSGVFVVKLSEQ